MQDNFDNVAFQPARDSLPTFERNLLKDQSATLLRDHILSGRIAPGAKLVERDVAAALGISRAPVRDALIQLEAEGIVVTRSTGRHVIAPGRHDIEHMYQVRRVLERLAVELAAQHMSPAYRQALAAKLHEMELAVAQRDRLLFVKNDVETHRLIWAQSGNAYLQSALNAMVGPIFVFASSNAGNYEWEETLLLHRDLITCLSSGDPEASVRSIERHMDNSVQRLLHQFGA